MDKLNIVKQAGQKLTATEVNMIASRVDELIDWVTEWSAQHPTAKVISGGLVVGLLDSYTYVDEPIEPNIELYVYGHKLVKGVDYVVKLYNNDGIGTGTIVLEGVGEYTGSINKTFAIDGVKYVVTFVSEHGSASKRKVSVVTANNLPGGTEMTDADYEFAGWYYDAELTKKVNVGDMLTSDTTMYAKWVEITYTVTWNFNGKGEGSVVVPTGKLSNMPSVMPVPKQSGYKCVGWYYADGTEAKAGDAVKANITVKAKWIGIDVVAVIDGDELKYEYDSDNCQLYVNGTLYIGAIQLAGTKSYAYELRYNGVKVNDDVTITTNYDYDEQKISWSSTKGAVVATMGGSTVTAPIAQSAVTGEITLKDSNETASVSVTTTT